MTGPAGAGPFPTFLIIGAPKAGTTSLAAYLAEHPDVFIAPEKEVHFFNRNFDKGTDWYRSRFADARGQKAIGEASPTYMYLPHALDRIAETLPDVRLIAILRNPIDRAYSHYWWMRAMFESRSFADAARAEMRGAPPPDPGRAYVLPGRYLDALELVAARFARDALRVVILEDLRDRLGEVYAEVCRHIGVDDGVAPPNLGDVVNPAYRVRSMKLRGAMLRVKAWRRLPFGLAGVIDRMNRASLRYEPMDPALRAELRDYYAEPNAALAGWLGRDLSAWNA